MAGIPAIKPYLMPTAVDLPGNTARWTVDPECAVLLLHDMQRYVLQPFPETFRDQLITNAALRERAIAALVSPRAAPCPRKGVLP